MFTDEGSSFWDVWEILEVSTSASHALAGLPVVQKERALDDIAEIFSVMVRLMKDRDTAFIAFKHVHGLKNLYRFLWNDIPSVYVIWNTSRMLLSKDWQGRILVDDFQSGAIH